MKKRINLFSRKKRFDVFAAYAVKIRRFGTLAGIIFFAIFAVLMYQIFLIQKDIRDLAKKKQLYLSILLDEKDVEANIRYFKGKQTQLTNFEKDDAHFLPYYQVLVSTVGTASNAALLDSVEIDKNRNTAFIVKFNDYDSMVSFLKYVESSAFLSNFDALSMASLSLSRPNAGSKQQNLNKNYQLQFKGKFKQINDESG